MYPAGFPGLGLLLLRIAVAMPLCQDVWNGWPSLAAWIACGCVLLAGALALGIATPVACLMTLALHFDLLASPHLIPNLLILLSAVSLALMGPGAFSCDARRFGRREIVLSHNIQDPR